MRIKLFLQLTGWIVGTLFIVIIYPVKDISLTATSEEYFAGKNQEIKNEVNQTFLLPGGIQLDLVWISAGSFTMGQREKEKDAYPNKETPQHPVTLSNGFWMGKYEVTKEQWRSVMGNEPWKGHRYVSDDPGSPAVYITWGDALAFTTKLATTTKRNFRLPTEAEWEYACRSGTTTRFYWGDDLDYEKIDHQAWWMGNTLITDNKYARSVGLLPPNFWGLYDMNGNVSEWCQDWHGYYYDGLAFDPVGAASGEHRVLRGGSWLCIGGHCRSSRRHHESPSIHKSDIGFRVVLGLSPKQQPGTPEYVNLFTSGTEGIHTYRIPGLLLSPDSSLLAFCEARKISQDDMSPTDMVLRRSMDSGRSWLPMQTIVQGQGVEALMNPCPVIDYNNNTIILICNNANKISIGHHQHFQLTSRDNGQTWSEPVDIGPVIRNYDNTFNPGPGVGLQMKTGRLIVPGYTGDLNEESEDEFYSRVLYSDDHGKSWSLGIAVSVPSDECQAVELADGNLILNMRGNMGMSCRGVAISEDGGQTWSKVRWDRTLNECPCQASLVRHSIPDLNVKGRILFSNPDNAGEKFNVVERTRMTVRVSYDEGETWPVKRLIHHGPSSYSTMVRLPDGDIGLLFEGGEKHRREWIRFARFSLSWLTQGEDHLEVEE